MRWSRNKILTQPSKEVLKVLLYIRHVTIQKVLNRINFTSHH